jgi:hypothetical protein
MPTEEPKVDKKMLDKVGALVRLANDKPEDSEEARTAALTVARMLKENDLVIIPRSELERVKTVLNGAHALAKRHQEDANQKMVIAGIAGLMASKVLKF